MALESKKGEERLREKAEGRPEYDTKEREGKKIGSNEVATAHGFPKRGFLLLLQVSMCD